jgi:hypothetical protein
LAVCGAVTAEVEIGKVVEVLLNGTVTLAGVCATALSHVIVTFTPPPVAAPFSTTVPVALDPPCTLEGATENAASCKALGGSISSVADCATPPACAVMVTVWTVVTVPVVAIWNCASACPVGIVNKSGS